MINKDMLNKNIKRWIAVFSAAALLTGSAFAVNEAVNENVKSALVSTAVETSASSETTKAVKDETVYVICDANGSSNQIIVSDHLKNMLNDASLKDVSKLKDIYNTNGDESFTSSDNGGLDWSADGKDIYYRGTTEAALPVDIEISYKLDGKEISASDLAGKSGHVSMHIAYKNNQYETVKISGEDTKIYVPFLVATGMILDNESFTNISIVNGKLIDDGSKTVAVGIALPGLNENLGLDKIDTTKFDKLDLISLPDSIDITADVTNFSLDMTMSVATNELFNNVDISNINLDDANALVTELTGGISQIVEGSGSLYNGLDTLLAKSKELSKGIDALSDGGNKLAAGAKELAAGTNKVNAGASDLYNGTAQVNAGATALYDGANKLNAGATDLYNGANQAHAGANGLAEGSKALASGSKDLSDGLNAISQNSANLNAGAKQVFDTLLNSAYTQLTSAGIPVEKLTIENYDKVLEGTIAFLSSNPAYASAKAQVTELKASLDSYKQFYTGVITYTTSVDTAALGASQINVGANSVYAGSKDLANGLATLSNGAAALSQGTKELSTGASTLKGGTASLKDGAAALSQGTKELSAGAGNLSTGAKTLSDGINTLKSSIPALIEGVTALRDGSKELYDGLNKVYTEGIEQLVNIYNGDIEALATRINATLEVSKNYKSFSGITDEMDGTVRFIYRTEAITAPSSDN